VAVVDPPRYHKLLVITDAAINVQPNVEEKLELVKNAVAVAERIGIPRPKVACIAPVEKVTEKVPSTVDAARLVELCSAGPEPVAAVVEGPFGLDVAISAEAAAVKGISGAVVGDADILLVPGIDAGNVLYKSISLLAGGTMSGMAAGALVPIVLTSRADTEESKYLSLLLALATAP
jgi:phosphate butyryltransferase